ncbi:ankyrin repeat-containing domain protein [Thelonectria olida]|uniref:Ankyrin repeat-containing domain protein n=1 Tax=Thelonectria olida TaxID=1576542 RepID=A0A9P8VX98_9HYPO|nr:ankyrin repeat-containing domain protein [Thelonectria olida]
MDDQQGAEGDRGPPRVVEQVLPYEDLFRRIEGGKDIADSIRSLIYDTEGSLDKPGRHGRTPLTWAVERGTLAAVDNLLTNAPVDKNGKDGQGQTAMACAAMRGDYNIFHRVANGLSVYVKDREGRTPLSLAAERGHITIVWYLVTNMKHWQEAADGKNATRDKHWVDEDNDGHTPLWWALTNHHQEVVNALVADDDSTTLHTLIQEDNDEAARNLIEAGYDLEKQDGSGQTALVLSIRAEKWDLVSRLITPGPYLDLKDDEGASALSLAVHERQHQLITMLIRSSASTKDIQAQALFEALDKDEEDWLVVSQASDGLQLNFVDEATFHSEARSTIPSVPSKRLFLWKNTKDWNPRWIPDMPDFNIQDSCAFITGTKKVQDQVDKTRLFYAIFYFDPTGCLPDRDTWRLDRMDGVDGMDGMGNISEDWGRSLIAWQIKLVTINGKTHWRPFNHFSTLGSPYIPADGMEFFTQFIGALEKKWMRLCSGGDNRMSGRRISQLILRGSSPDLVENLAKDAQKWAELRDDLRDQVEAALKFARVYCRKYNKSIGLKTTEQAINDLNNHVTARLDKLDQTVRDLLQVEFAWASIHETHKSTTISLSMKRLSWITSLFGMNVNSLENNPDWRWYVAFSGGTMGLTVLAWLIFKYNPNIEPWVEKNAGKTGRRLKDATVGKFRKEKYREQTPA